MERHYKRDVFARLFDEYNIFVTTYPSENSSELKDYLKSKNNIVITGEKMKKALSQRGLGSMVPALLNDNAFFDDSILDSDKKVKENISEEQNQDRYPALLKLQVEELVNEKTGEPILRDYILQNIEEEPVSKSKRFSKAHLEETDSPTINISYLVKLVKMYDKDFTPTFPVDEHLLKDGKPKVFYHGTNKPFTEFKYDEIASWEGSFFFAENRKDAEAYGKNVYEVYLRGKKLADYDNQPSEFYRLKDKKGAFRYRQEW